MTEHTLMIADATQFFDTVSAFDVVSSMQELEKRICQRGFQCVMVKRSGMSSFLGKAEEISIGGMVNKCSCSVSLGMSEKIGPKPGENISWGAP